MDQQNTLQNPNCIRKSLKRNVDIEFDYTHTKIPHHHFRAPQESNKNGSTNSVRQAKRRKSLVSNIEDNFECEIKTDFDFSPEDEMILGPEYSIQPFDVMCLQRGCKDCVLEHVGNERFRVIIEMNLDRYCKASTRSVKSQIVREIVESIRRSGAKFVRQEGDCVYDIGNKRAREKVGHAIRGILGKNICSSSESTRGFDHSQQHTVDGQSSTSCRRLSDLNDTQKLENVETVAHQKSLSALCRTIPSKEEGNIRFSGSSDGISFQQKDIGSSDSALIKHHNPTLHSSQMIVQHKQEPRFPIQEQINMKRSFQQEYLQYNIGQQNFPIQEQINMKRSFQQEYLQDNISQQHTKLQEIELESGPESMNLIHFEEHVDSKPTTEPQTLQQLKRISQKKRFDPNFLYLTRNKMEQTLHDQTSHFTKAKNLSSCCMSELTSITRNPEIFFQDDYVIQHHTTPRSQQKMKLETGYHLNRMLHCTTYFTLDDTKHEKNLQTIMSPNLTDNMLVNDIDNNTIATSLRLQSGQKTISHHTSQIPFSCKSKTEISMLPIETLIQMRSDVITQVRIQEKMLLQLQCQIKDYVQKLDLTKELKSEFNNPFSMVEGLSELQNEKQSFILENIDILEKTAREVGELNLSGIDGSSISLFSWSSDGKMTHKSFCDSLGGYVMENA